jgi:gas vesicle structural protein
VSGVPDAPVPGENAGLPAELEDPHTLVELLNRVLDRGVVISGHVTISVAGVDLVYLGLNAVLTSVSTARRLRRGGEAR